MKKNFNRNPDGHNQWVLRSNEEIQEIIDKHPTWTKKKYIVKYIHIFVAYL